MEPDFFDVLETAYPGEVARFFAPMFIGDTRESGDDGAALILAGIKTTTSSAFWHYPDGKIPFIGALSVLLDGQRQPRGIVETVRLEIIPFCAIDAAFALAYGEGERTLKWWRREMGEWYRAGAARHGTVFNEDAPLICEWLKLVKHF